MDAQHLLNVLGMLRMLKASGDPNKTIMAVIKEWAGSDVGDATVLRIAAHLHEEVNLATETLKAAQLSDEVKEGIIPKMEKFASGFAIGAFQGNVKQFCPDIPGMITTIAVIVEASGIPPSPEPPKEIHSLIRDILDLVSGLDGNLDPIIRSTIKQHAQILVALLQNMKIFGVEIALSSYFELMKKVQRANESASRADQKPAKPIIERIKGWASMLESIHKAWEAGTKIITDGEKVVTPLLTHLAK